MVKQMKFDHSISIFDLFVGKRDKYKEAEPLCERALEIREKHLGSCHPDVAKQLTNLALICQNQKKFDQVEHYYQRAIDIYGKSLGLMDSNVIKTKTNLASVYLEENKFELAEQLFKEILFSCYEKEYLTSTSKTDSHRTTNGQGQWHKHLHSDLPTVISTLQNLIVVYRRQGRHETAEFISQVRKEPKAISDVIRYLQSI